MKSTTQTKLKLGEKGTCANCNQAITFGENRDGVKAWRHNDTGMRNCHIEAKPKGKR